MAGGMVYTPMAGPTDMWGGAAGVVSPPPMGQSGKMTVGRGSGAPTDEREVKRQRRKQSNRESARRSRLRKQAECEELIGRQTSLQMENMGLRTELTKIQENFSSLMAHNAQLRSMLQEAGIDIPAEEASFQAAAFPSPIQKFPLGPGTSAPSTLAGLPPSSFLPADAKAADSPFMPSAPTAAVAAAPAAAPEGLTATAAAPAVAMEEQPLILEQGADEPMKIEGPSALEALPGDNKGENMVQTDGEGAEGALLVDSDQQQQPWLEPQEQLLQEQAAQPTEVKEGEAAAAVEAEGLQEGHVEKDQKPEAEQAETVGDEAANVNDAVMDEPGHGELEDKEEAEKVDKKENDEEAAEKPAKTAEDVVAADKSATAEEPAAEQVTSTEQVTATEQAPAGASIAQGTETNEAPSMEDEVARTEESGLPENKGGGDAAKTSDAAAEVGEPANMSTDPNGGAEEAAGADAGETNNIGELEKGEAATADGAPDVGAHEKEKAAEEAIDEAKAA
eukprot:TRINITY_DN194_c2_g1_i2.p1 TRINITY_DN194_c2_g1~~TRINITY_DN194_c2_g1_i2.p1  ORF type:complete len:569 (-),score=93.63 TRINITY_DN194_c2_g1_i2:192-1709(-)